MKWARVGCIVAAVTCLVAMLPLNEAFAQTTLSQFVGKWQLNIAQSKIIAGETPPNGLVTQIDRVDTAHVHWSTISTDANGQKDTEIFDNPGNGEFYSLNGYTMVAHRLSASALQSTYKDSSGQIDVLTCTLSANLRQMTCNGIVTRGDGSVSEYTDVFDRV